MNVFEFEYVKKVVNLIGIFPLNTMVAVPVCYDHEKYFFFEFWNLNEEAEKD